MKKTRRKNHVRRFAKKNRSKTKRVTRTKKKSIVKSHSRNAKRVGRSKTKRSATRVRSGKLSNRGSGYNITKNVFSRKLGKEVKLKRAEKIFAKPDRLPIHKRQSLDFDEAFVSNSMTQQLKKVGKSKEKLYLFKIKYRAKINGKWRIQYISGSAAKIGNEFQMEKYLKHQIMPQLKKLRGYISRGWADIEIIGTQVQAYG